MLTSAPQKTDILKQYNDFLATRPKFCTPKPDCPDHEKIKFVKELQHEWFEGECFLPKPFLFWKSKENLDASTGSSGFLPPQWVESKLKLISASQLADYNDQTIQPPYTRKLTKYFSEQGIIGVDENPLVEGYRFYRGISITEMFSFLLKPIIHAQKDVFVVPTPTYTLFFAPLLEAKAEILTFALLMKNGFKPDLTALNLVIRNKNRILRENYLKNIEMVEAIFGIISNNLVFSSHFREGFQEKINFLKTFTAKLEIENYSEIDNHLLAYQKLLDLFSWEENGLSDWKDKLYLNHCPRVRGYLNINPHMPTGVVLTQSDINALASSLQEFPDIIIIDDLSYFELIFPIKNLSPGSFAKSTLKPRTVSLYPVSKQFSLAGVRTGIAFGPTRLIESLSSQRRKESGMIPVHGIEAIDAVINSNQTLRDEYLHENVETYSRNCDFAVALIKGISAVPSDKHTKVKEMLKSIKGLTEEKRQELLLGISGLDIITYPHSGFFLLIDFSAYQNYFLGDQQLTTGADIRNALYNLAGLNTLQGELCFFFEKPMVLRWSFCLRPVDMVESIMRIKSILSLCKISSTQKEEEKNFQTDPLKQLSVVTHCLKNESDTLSTDAPLLQKSVLFGFNRKNHHNKQENKNLRSQVKRQKSKKAKKQSRRGGSHKTTAGRVSRLPSRFR